MWAGNGPPAAYNFDDIARSGWLPEYADEADENQFQDLTAFMTWYHLEAHEFWRYMYEVSYGIMISQTSKPPLSTDKL